MRVISKKASGDFWQLPGHADAQAPLAAWHREAKAAAWRDPMDIKAKYRTVSILKSGRVVFNIGGNKYRIVAEINYPYGILYIRFVGTHEQYDRINAEEVR